MAKSHSGPFKPLNYKKYKGNPTKIFYRSFWELTLMTRFDADVNILEWSSEEIIIRYKDPLTGTIRRYFPDFWVKKRNKNGKIEQLIIEVKPLHQVVSPAKINKRDKTYLKEVATYVNNRAKWEAAKKYCESRNYKFCVITVITKDKKDQFQLLTEEQLGL